MCGPAEGRKFWTYWFGNDIDERSEAGVDLARTDRRMRYLRRVWSVLSSPERPILTGYLGHVLRWQKLEGYLPEVIFVRLHRDPVDNALSLLRCRRRHQADWFSVFPGECGDSLSGTVHEQVAAQVYWLNRRMDGLADSNTVHIHYSELCRDPALAVRKVADFCDARGFRLNIRDVLPRSFDDVVGRETAQEDVALVKDSLDRLQRKYGEL
jgi:hypothetical protein